jgi:hypothetical protein
MLLTPANISPRISPHPERLFLHDGGPLWRSQEMACRCLFENDGFEYEPVSSRPQRPGQFSLISAGGGAAQLLFWPRSNSNPNLDGRGYRLVTDDYTYLHRAGREQIPPDERLAVDLFANPKIRDFVNGFRREHADEIWDVYNEPAVAVFAGITSTGSTSASFALHHGGGRCVFLPGWETSERTKAELAALTVGVETIPEPDYPPQLTMHHWVNLQDKLPRIKHWSMVREPVRRLVSKYYWGLDTTGGNGQSLDDWLNDICCGYGDWQLRWFSNISQDKTFCTHLNIDPEIFVSTDSGLVLKDKLLAEAYTNVESHFFMVGVTELFDESLFVHALLTGARFVGKWPMECASSAPRDRLPVGDAALRRLRRHAECEISFYENMKAYFERQYADAINFFRENIGPLRCA